MRPLMKGTNGHEEENWSSRERRSSGRDASRRIHGPSGPHCLPAGEDLKLPPPRVNDIVREKRGISADTALRLARYFGNSPEFWMNMQTRYDLLIARANSSIAKIKPRRLEAAGLSMTGTVSGS